MFTTSRILLTLAVVLMAQTAQGVIIEYHADVEPDDSSLQQVFSTHVGSGTSWSASGGELTMTTAPLNGVWFGNHASNDPVPWQIADSSEGNFVSIRARLEENSGEWGLQLMDGSHIGELALLEGEVLYFTPLGEPSYAIDTTEYHVYSCLLKNGWVTYRVDGDVIYSGTARVLAHSKNIIIGDDTAVSDDGYGSMIVDEVTIETDLPTPLPSISSGGLALLGGLVVAIAVGGLAAQRGRRAL
jgi:hypothetical protein